MDGVKQVGDQVCLACGCLCDDIRLEIATLAASAHDATIVRAERACSLGEHWFLKPRPGNVPACHVDGQPADANAGLDRAATILASVGQPLVIGLAGLVCEAQREAVALADRLGGVVLPASGAAAALDLAVQAVGAVTATLGEVRHRADLVIFWGVDPATTHPRHFERYSLEPTGEFVPRGRADRTCIVVDVERTATAAVADLFLPADADARREAIDVLQLLANDKATLDAAEVELRSGAPLETWRALVAQMKSARCGVFFFNPAAASESLLKLVRDLNRHTRFVCLPLGSAGNGAGADQLVAWQTGYAGPVDFSSGAPREFETSRLAEATRCAIILACDPVADALAALAPVVRDHIAAIPNIVLHTADVPPLPSAAVGFTVATPSIHAAGTVFRSDGVPLPLRAAIASPYPPAETLLQSIADRLHANY